jgi:hypothetical protein
MLSAMQDPHWLIVAGSVLVVLGSSVLCFAKTGLLNPTASRRK